MRPWITWRSLAGGDIRLAVKVVIGEDKVLVDYEGTDPPQVPPMPPLNAVLGVTISGGVHFVFRTLLGGRTSRSTTARSAG